VVFGLNLLEGFLDGSIYSLVLFWGKRQRRNRPPGCISDLMNVLPLSKLLNQGLPDVLAQRDAAAGGSCFRLAEQVVRQINRGLYAPILPYLRADNELMGLGCVFRA
jgi:hypothetical protein